MSIIDRLFIEWLDRVDAWKEIVLELAESAHMLDSPFTPNAKRGFSYMSAVVICTQCRKCGDTKAFRWLDAFARAWIDRTHLPLFDEGCWIEECDGVV